jgi:hypothetical protein
MKRRSSISSKSGQLTTTTTRISTFLKMIKISPFRRSRPGQFCLSSGLRVSKPRRRCISAALSSKQSRWSIQTSLTLIESAGQETTSGSGDSAERSIAPKKLLPKPNELKKLSPTHKFRRNQSRLMTKAKTYIRSQQSRSDSMATLKPLKLKKGLPKADCSRV